MRHRRCLNWRSSSCNGWPPLTPNLHRLAFDDGRVELLLALGDIADWLPEIVASVDAFFLDGFAPDRNPAMWQPRVFKALGRLAAPGATVATWSVASAVREGLVAAGFEVRNAPGSGGKREITLARHAPRFQPRRAPARIGTAPSASRHALIVGAGLAGTRGRLCLGRAGVAQHALRPPGLDRGGHVRQSGRHLSRHGQPARWHARPLQPRGGPAGADRGRWRHRRRTVSTVSVSGLLRVETRASAREMAAQLSALGLPADYVQALDAVRRDAPERAAAGRAGVVLPWRRLGRSGRIRGVPAEAGR